MLHEEPCAVPRIQGEEDLRRARDLDGTQEADDDEPAEHDWPEHTAHARGAEALPHEEEEKQSHGSRHHEMAQLGNGDLDALEGAQHGDGGGDHAVAVEEGRTEEAQPHQEPAPALLEDEGEERQDPALAAVVEPHDDEDVLHGHDQDERPHDQGQDAVDSGGVPRQAHLRTEASAKSVERAGADVAVDYAEGGEGEDAQPASPRPRSIMRDGGSGVMAP